MAWFTADDCGGWSQFLNKLAVNKLYYDGGLVPEKKEAITDAITDLVNGCVEAGASSLTVPASSVPYSELVSAMRDSGALKSTVVNTPPGPITRSPEEEALLANHKEQVDSKIFIKFLNGL